jgi:hypothetical protein
MSDHSSPPILPDSVPHHAHVDGVLDGRSGLPISIAIAMLRLSALISQLISRGDRAEFSLIG